MAFYFITITNMSFKDDDEITEDTDLELENSEEESEEDLEEEDELPEDDESDDDAPATQKDVKKLLKIIENQKNAARRTSSKPRELPTKQPKSADRLERIEQSQAKMEMIERKRLFGYENNLAPSEVDFVFQLTKRPTKSFLVQPHVKGGIDALRAVRNVRDNTPGSSGRTFQVEGKSWKELAPEDKQKNFVNRRRSLVEANRNR